MRSVHEKEKKYLLKYVNKCENWDREQIVYQWYIDVSGDEHTKEKVIFNLLDASVIYVRISKKRVSLGEAEKTVEYLQLKDLDPASYLGKPFVLKRRSIKNKIFLDKMIRSNGACDLLLEDEGDGPLADWEEIGLLRDVTDDETYYNQNMCTPFTEQDFSQLCFLIECFSMDR